MKKEIVTTFAIALLFCAQTYGQSPNAMPTILSMKARAELQEKWMKERMETVLPEIMRRNKADMWVVIGREYNEDPVLRTLLPPTWLSARRTTMLVMTDLGPEHGIEALAVARYGVGSAFKKAWDPEEQPDQWQRLAEIIAERDPKTIAINTSDHFPLADGLTASLKEKLMGGLSDKYKKRVKSVPELSIGWLETRTESEMVVYRQIMRIAQQIISEGLSEEVIQPGHTTTNDVVWYYRDRIRELGLVAWFHPTCDVQRPDNEEEQRSFASRPGEEVIMPGDLVHIDFGITYLGLNTDTQQNAYVLKAGETEVPSYLAEAHKTGLRLMDILTGHFKTGRTGNEILAATIASAKAAGIDPQIYTHPIGYHGHAAGTTIGLWDQQGGVPVNGDYPLFPNTAHSIELNAKVYLEEWGKLVRVMLEEDAFFDGEKVYYINGRQTDIYTIPRQMHGIGD